MRESYVVGYDPQMKIWAVEPVSADYPDDFWVFKVSARDDKEALSKALAQFGVLTATPCPTELAVLKHVDRQARRLCKRATTLFAVDLPTALLSKAKEMITKSFFIPGHEDQILIDTTGAAWKAIRQHLDFESTRRISPSMLEI